MKKFIITMIVGASLSLIASQALAGQEGYGVPKSPGPGSAHNTHPVPGSPAWHSYNCGLRQKNGHAVYGYGYQLQVSIAPYAPQYNITGCSMKEGAVTYPDSSGSWTETYLKQLDQNTQMAKFGDDSMIVIIEKEHYSAKVQFADGSSFNCVLR